jgi:hypothetical protein
MLRFSISLLLLLLLMPFSAKAEELNTDILVVGGSQSGVMAAIQAARMGKKVVLASQSDWLGGSMTEAGVSAIDGNELLAFQTGLWGEFLKRLAEKEKNLLHYSWVSLFAFNPQNGKEVLSNWVKENPNITWIQNTHPIEVFTDKPGRFRRVTGVKFADGTTVKAKITVDATEFGDLLELGKLPSRLGWEYSAEFNEPSAPLKKSELLVRYPLQELTWVFYIKDYGSEGVAPKIETPIGYTYEKAAKRYWCAFKNPKLLKISKSAIVANSEGWYFKYLQAEKIGSFFDQNTFLTYGQVAPEYFMINWPKCGNDYSLGIERLYSGDPDERERFLKEAQVQSLWFAKYIQDTLGERFGLADDIFPANDRNYNVGGLAYIPYNREVRRIQGLETLTENDLLTDLGEGEYAKFREDSIAIGNYANDHHYFEMAEPGTEKYFKLKPKSFQWGGRYTGTPFAIPYGVVIPASVDGFLVAEKSWSVSHIANGSSRLQPVCIAMGQAVGAIASVSLDKNLEPYQVDFREVQAQLLNDPFAPATLVPLFDVKPDNRYRASIQRMILADVIDFPRDGNFKPKEKISREDLTKWAKRAKASLNIDMLSPSLKRDEAAFLIDKNSNAFDKVGPKEKTGQAMAKYPTAKYCAILKQGGNSKTFKVEGLKTYEGDLVYRSTPFSNNPANTAGVITFDPEVYDYLQNNAEKTEWTCFEGAYNHSGAWVLITKVLESDSNKDINQEIDEIY